MWQMIVELEPSVDCTNDPSRILVKKYAKEFQTMPEAMVALIAARKYHQFKNAVIGKDLI
jgi:hypothetical protein